MSKADEFFAIGNARERQGDVVEIPKAKRSPLEVLPPRGAVSGRPLYAFEFATALILWLLFGFLGAHRIYLGHGQSGAAQLVMTLASTAAVIFTANTDKAAGAWVALALWSILGLWLLLDLIGLLSGRLQRA